MLRSDTTGTNATEQSGESGAMVPHMLVLMSKSNHEHCELCNIQSAVTSGTVVWCLPQNSTILRTCGSDVNKLGRCFCRRSHTITNISPLSTHLRQRCPHPPCGAPRSPANCVYTTRNQGRAAGDGAGVEQVAFPFKVFEGQILFM